MVSTRESGPGSRTTAREPHPFCWGGHVTVRPLKLAAALMASTTLAAASAQPTPDAATPARSEEHTSELQSRQYLVCRLLLENKKHLSERAGPTLAHRRRRHRPRSHQRHRTHLLVVRCVFQIREYQLTTER